jgi:hypothetical protein
VCMTCLAPTSEGRRSGILLDEPAAEPVRLSRDEVYRLIRENNAQRPVSHPVCRQCELPFHPEDADVFDARLCVTCGWRRLENRALDLVYAKGRKARKRALRRLLSIAK